jgi:hypothetical protein
LSRLPLRLDCGLALSPWGEGARLGQRARDGAVDGTRTARAHDEGVQTVRRSRFVAAAVAALAGGCASSLGTPPAVAIETRFGTVRAGDGATARVAADAYLEFADALADLAPDMRTPEVDVWVQDRIQVRAGSIRSTSANHLSGIILSRGAEGAYRIEISKENRLGDGFEGPLAHELVHAMLGPSWETLPAALEEGLCDSLSSDVMDRSLRRLPLLATAARWEELDAICLFRARGDDGEWADFYYRVGVEMTPDTPRISNLTVGEILARRDIHSGRIEDSKRIYAVGFTLVQLVRERVGITGLHHLCVRAGAQGLRTIPADWILSAAGVRDEADLGSQAQRLVAENPAAVLDYMGTLQRGSLLRELRARSGFETEDADAFFRLVQPRIQILDGPPYALADFPGLIDWARTTWGDLAP